jgi:hypothetical protein
VIKYENCGVQARNIPMEINKGPDNRSDLQQFRVKKLGEHYLEQDLEDWLEKSLTVLPDGKPILIIGRQVSTSLTGRIDLLGLDADGATVIIELKRDLTPRDVIAQALEYTAYIARLDHPQITRLAETYLNKQKPPLTLPIAWQDAFGSTNESIAFNIYQRILIVAKSADRRTEAVTRFLRDCCNLDISLLEYGYFETESGEEVLDIQPPTRLPPAKTKPQAKSKYNEAELLATWSIASQAAYQAFREHLGVETNQLLVIPTQTILRFLKQTTNGLIYSCYYTSRRKHDEVSFHKPSLYDQLNMDIDVALAAIEKSLPSGATIHLGTTWDTIHFPATRETAQAIATLILKHIITQVK